MHSPIARRPCGPVTRVPFSATVGFGMAGRAPNCPEADMAGTNWTIHGREFVNCNCSYGCPCQFNGLPTYGDCRAVAGMKIEEGNHGTTKLDGLAFVGIFRWPGAIHEGKGEAAVVVDEEASQDQRGAILCLLTGQE